MYIIRQNDIMQKYINLLEPCCNFCCRFKQCYSYESIKVGTTGIIEPNSLAPQTPVNK